MKRVFLIGAIGLLTGVVCASEPLLPSDFALAVPLATSGDGLHAVELDESIYRAGTTRSLADLRIFNAKREALPLAVLPPAPAPQPVLRVIDLTLAPLPGAAEARASALQAYAVRFERNRDGAVIEIKASEPVPPLPLLVGGFLIDARPLKDASGHLQLQFAPQASDYAGRVEVLGSEDLVHWRVLATGALARDQKLGDTIEKGRFELRRPPSFLRVAWSTSSAPMLSGARFEQPVSAEVRAPRARLATTLSDDRRSLYVDVPVALPVQRVFIRAQEANQSTRVMVFRHVADPAPRARRLGLVPRRAPEHWVAAGSLDVLRITRDGVEIEGAALALTVPVDRLRIDSESPWLDPLPVVEAEWVPARIAFAARAPGPYRLAIGRVDAPNGPSLNLHSVLPADDPAGTRLPPARVEANIALPQRSAEVTEQRAQRIAAQAHWSRIALWAVLLAAVLGLAWMAWRLATQLRRPSPEAAADGPSRQ